MVLPHTALLTSLEEYLENYVVGVRIATIGLRVIYIIIQEASGHQPLIRPRLLGTAPLHKL